MAKIFKRSGVSQSAVNSAQEAVDKDTFELQGAAVRHYPSI